MYSIFIIWLALFSLEIWIILISSLSDRPCRWWNGSNRSICPIPKGIFPKNNNMEEKKEIVDEVKGVDLVSWTAPEDCLEVV